MDVVILVFFVKNKKDVFYQPQVHYNQQLNQQQQHPLNLPPPATAHHNLQILQLQREQQQFQIKQAIIKIRVRLDIRFGRISERIILILFDRKD